RPVSATFHGRDIFAPVAARVACGAALTDAGEPIDPEGLVALSLPSARLEDDALVAHATYVDAFGNVQLDAGPADPGRLGLALGQEVVIGDTPARYVRTFGDAGFGELVLYEDSDWRLAVAVNRGSAAERLGVVADDELWIRPG